MRSKEEILRVEECEIILERHFHDRKFKIIKYDIVPISEGVEGYLGEHYFIKIKFKRSNEILNKSFFAKIPPLNYNLQLEFTRMSNAFEKEIFFYEAFVKYFKKYSTSFNEDMFPKYFYSRGNDLIVMENLREKNYREAEAAHVLDLKHLKLILKVLAKIHSASLTFEEKKSVEIKKPFRLIDDYPEYLTEGFFQRDTKFLGFKWHEASLKGIITITDKMPLSEMEKIEFKKKFKELTEKCFEIVKPSKKFRNVCCHGDLWKKNVLFQYENGIPVNCKIIDFQLTKYNPPAFDVIKIIYQSTSSEMRKNHFHDLLKYFYDNLGKELTLEGLDPRKIISREEFQASVRYMLPHCKVETAYYYTFSKTDLVYMKKILSNNDNFRNFVFGDRSDYMLKSYCNDSNYKHWLDEILLDIKDMLYNNDLTREDCYAILRSKLNTTNYDLINYVTTHLEEKSGFLGEHLKIKIDIIYNNEKLSEYFFAKRIPDSALTNFIMKSGAFNNEKIMYDNIFHKMNLFGINNIYNSVPKCYYITNDMLVFEDLNTIGFEVINKHKSLDFDELVIVIKALANYHGSILLLEEILTNNNQQKFRVVEQYVNDIVEVNYVKDKDHLGYKAVDSAIKGLYTMVDLYPDPLSSITDNQFKNCIKKYYEQKVYELVSPSKKYRNVICHGDLWASNLMIKYDLYTPIECRIVDFQIARLCPPAHDVMAVIYLTTSRKFRANYLNEIINLYHQELGNIMKKYNFNVENVLPWKEFSESCEEYKTYAIYQMTTHFPIIMMKSDDMAEFIEDFEFSEKMMFDDRTDFIKKMFEQDEQYRYILGESIKDLRILCENYILQCTDI